MSKRNPKSNPISLAATGDYPGLVGGISELLEAARRASARTVNAFMTATYWEIGRRIVEFEQGGEKRAEYGEALLERLSQDLTAKYGRGFARPNLIRFRRFYQAFPTPGIRSASSNESSALNPICSTVSNELPVTPIVRTAPGQSLTDLARAFPLPWSHYVLLISRSRSPEAFAFYHTEALRGGWSVRQLQRQMDMYLNYAREHWMQPGENPPVGVILCSSKSEALVRYATDTLPNKLLVREYLTALPDEKILAAELEKTRKQLEARK